MGGFQAFQVGVPLAQLLAHLLRLKVPQMLQQRAAPVAAAAGKRRADFVIPELMTAGSAACAAALSARAMMRPMC